MIIVCLIWREIRNWWEKEEEKEWARRRPIDWILWARWHERTCGIAQAWRHTKKRGREWVDNFTDVTKREWGWGDHGATLSRHLRPSMERSDWFKVGSSLKKENKQLEIFFSFILHNFEVYICVLIWISLLYCITSMVFICKIFLWSNVSDIS